MAHFSQKDYYILGVRITDSFQGHDSAAALIKNGQIVAEIAEERLNRIKHSPDLPFCAIEECLKIAGISFHEVDEIAAVKNKTDISFKHIFGNQTKNSGEDVGTPPYYRRFFLKSPKKVTFVPHHLAHAASAYYSANDSRKMVVVTMDGIGDDDLSSCVWLGENGKITPLALHSDQGSLGWFYSNVTEALGWQHGGGEGKTMGLAPYGNPDICRERFAGFYPVFKNGDLVAPHQFFEIFPFSMNGMVHWHSQDAIKLADIITECGRENAAAAAEKIFEEQALEFLLPWLEREQTGILAASGGVFLNVKLNQRIWESGKVKEYYPYPNCGDGGLAVGAALYAAAQNGQIKEPVISHMYRGPEYSNEEIEKILSLRKIPYRRSSDPAVDAAEHLAEGKIIGWFQGKMEAGPRALGNRSILMSPKDPMNKGILNSRVKFRESFRPFCPSMTDESKERYLVNPRRADYMITSFDATDAAKKEIPAVVHIDGTLRPQTVAKESNPKYWQLLENFGKLTGTPVLLNTSFNTMGEPIVCSPVDAIRCFFGSGIDSLFLGDFIIEKKSDKISEPMHDEITTIIFSKNRACQLELLLRGIHRPVTVIYKHDPEFRAGYEKLISMYPAVRFLPETDFRSQVMENLGEYTMFLVDDDVILESIDEVEKTPEFERFKREGDLICLSLRLTPHYANPPVMENNTWKWDGCGHDWGYPMSVSSHVFRKKDLLACLGNRNFTMPNELEVVLRTYKNRRLSRMLCFDKPKIINNHANQVQSLYPSKNIGVPLSRLERKFLAGRRLSREHIKKAAETAIRPFVQVAYEFEGEKDHWLSEYKKDVTSEAGEDGITEKIFEILGVEKGWCVDVGARGFRLSNTYSLMMKGWSGVLFEKDKNYWMRLRKMYFGRPAYCFNECVFPYGEKSLEKFLRETPMPKNFDFLSIDIGGNDYHIWNALYTYSPSVVVIAFNPVLKLDEYVQSVDGRGGASLKALVALGKEKGYELVATTALNAFFVKKELFPRFKIADNSPEELFTPSDKTYEGDGTKYVMPEVPKDDITIVYYTANKISDYFSQKVKEQLLKSAGNIPIVSVSQKPIDLGENICVGDIGQSIFNIYRQALIGAKAAKTKYIAMAEDDLLYSPDHFSYRPTPGVFAYNGNTQGLYTWLDPPVFGFRGRTVLSTLICERELFIRAMEEREAKYPKDEERPLKRWGEPGRWDKWLGVTSHKIGFYYTRTPDIIFSHPESMCYMTMGKRKALGDLRAEVLPYWGTAQEVRDVYKPPEVFISSVTDTLGYIVRKFGVSESQKSPVELSIGRDKEFLALLSELGLKKGVELGIYKGGYSELIMRNMPELDFTGVDVWKSYEGYVDYREKRLLDAYEIAKARAEKFKFKIIRDWTVNAAKEFADESLDFIYIDGNHDFAHVVEDLAAWSPKVKKGGIISGHDFFESEEERYGVFHAVPAWCAMKKVPMFFITKNDTFPSWFYVKT